MIKKTFSGKRFLNRIRENLWKVLSVFDNNSVRREEGDV